MNRRDLLKLFGAGTAIVPVIGSKPVLAAEAILVEPPKIEVVQEIPQIQPKVSIPFVGTNPDVVHLSVTYTISDGEIHTFDVDTIMTETKVDYFELGERWGPRELIERERRIEYSFRGRMVPATDGSLIKLRKLYPYSQVVSENINGVTISSDKRFGGHPDYSGRRPR